MSIGQWVEAEVAAQVNQINRQVVSRARRSAVKIFVSFSS